MPSVPTASSTQLNGTPQHLGIEEATVPSVLDSRTTYIDLTSDNDDVPETTAKSAFNGRQQNHGTNKVRSNLQHNINHADHASFNRQTIANRQQNEQSRILLTTTVPASAPTDTQQSLLNPAQQPSIERSRNYVPANNSSFTAYAMTHAAMGFGSQRKHGPKSTW